MLGGNSFFICCLCCGGAVVVVSSSTIVVVGNPDMNHIIIDRLHAVFLLYLVELWTACPTVCLCALFGLVSIDCYCFMHPVCLIELPAAVK